MKPSDPKPTTNSRILTKCSGWTSAATSIVALTLALCPDSSAQSATNFDTRKITPEASITTPEQTTAAPAKEGTTVDTGPSRYIGETALAPYVQSLSSVFSIRTRATDPFGQYQDPTAKPIVKPTIAKTTRSTTTQITPFADIIDRIRITTIMPGEQRFLIGTRSFKKGDRFPIKFRGKDINVEVAVVDARKVGFRNVQNGETANLKLNLLPVGMTPGNGKITTPGMERDRADSPLEIEPINSSDELPQN